VLNYGTSATGAQGAQFIYDVWDPSVGTDTNSHTVLPNTTTTDLFCSSQSLMLSGEVLTSGGDLTVNAKRNSANNTTTIFSPSANTLTPNTAMTYPRWYPTLLALPDGELAVFGGRQNVGALTPVTAATTPELYNPALNSWTPLTGATSDVAFGGAKKWFYPRAFVAPGGKVFQVNDADGKMFFISTANGGSIKQYTPMAAPVGDFPFPTIPFAPTKLLSIRQNQVVVIIDYSTSTPVITQTDPIDQVRFWANGTVLADGRVLVTGGSAVGLASESSPGGLVGVDYQAQIWDPKTGHWTAGASASKPRLYHSNSMLLPDATVLTGGGGAPGPVTNLNAEIYYPPYLYASDGTPAVRPTILSTDLSTYDPGAALTATVGPSDSIARLTLLRTGSSTHSLNTDQRFIELSFTQSGQTLVAQLPSDSSVVVPGFYMLFAINVAGVPSEARLFSITANAPPPPNFVVSPTTAPFGVVQVGATSATQPVTVTNNGGPLAPFSVNFSGPGAVQFSQTNSCGNSVAAGSTCTVNVAFAPIAAGYTFATMNITGSGVTHTVAVNGTGKVPFKVSPSAVSFGNVSTGTQSAPDPITVTNLGTAALPITGISLTGNAAGQFSQTNNCSTPVPVGSFCTVNVVFAPTSTGTLSATLSVTAPGATHTSALSGTGVSP